VGNFLISWVTIRFSRRTLLHVGQLVGRSVSQSFGHWLVRSLVATKQNTEAEGAEVGNRVYYTVSSFFIYCVFLIILTYSMVLDLSFLGLLG
jgi:hypothetical protein